MNPMKSRKNLPKIYFDACCFIDMITYDVKGNMKKGVRENAETCKKLIEKCIADEVTVVTSTLSKAECLYVERIDGTINTNEEVQIRIAWLFDSQKSGIYTIQPIGNILDIVRKFRWDYNVGINGMDAIHLATAIYLKCDEFLTRDNKTIITPHKSFFSTLDLQLLHPSETSHIQQDRQNKIQFKEPLRSVNRRKRKR